VVVHMAENELPEIEDLHDRLLEMARRLGLRVATCSKPLADLAERRGLQVIDLRKVGDNLTPDFAPGEQVVIDLSREGNQPRQAVGYLPDGDMVVVNDAAHMIGREDVVVEVLSTRRTHQGLLVFASLADRYGATEGGDRRLPGRVPNVDRGPNGNGRTVNGEPAQSTAARDD
jgi:uncharacterized protein YacL